MSTRIHTVGVRPNHAVLPEHADRPARAGRRLRRHAIAAALTVTVGVTLAACGDDSDSGSAPPAAQTASNGDVFNEADISFATDMIQHHAQALVMGDMAAGRPLDPEVEELAGQIRDAQSPEIETMTDWLTAWDQEVPETVRDHTNSGHDMGSMDMGDMPGMMSAEEMGELESSSDAEFQDMWLQMMIEHHQGAIEMAQEQQDAGTFEDATALAESIESSQQQEIDLMEDLLG